MSDYLSFVYGGLSRSSGDALEDGQVLARQCLRKLEDIDRKRFPPKLLILLASPAYLERQKAEQLLRSVNETFNGARESTQPTDGTREDVPLIGSSVGGVFFDRRIHPEGALLVCLASYLIDARVGCGRDARKNRLKAVKDLLGELGLDQSENIDPNPLANRLLITFLPGCKEGSHRKHFYPAPELHRRLYEGMQTRIWMIGGVSSANDRGRTKDGWQFAGMEVLRDSVVAASIVTGVPIGVSLNDAFDSTDPTILRATELDSKDKRIVLKFDDQVAQARLDTSELVMLAKLSAGEERTVDIPLPKEDGSVQLLRPIKVGDHFQLLRPGKEIAETVWNGIKQAKQRVFVQHPVASLLFPCKVYSPRGASDSLAVENALAKVEHELGDKPCVGGFFDGELGVDETGRSRLTNGGVGYIILGDELRERTPLYKGVSALAGYGPKLLAGVGLTAKGADGKLDAIALVNNTLDNALKIVDDTGFPGAMISLVLHTLDREAKGEKKIMIARQGIGLRFPKIVALTKRPCEEDDILAVVGREGKARFVPDSTKDEFCDQETIELSGIVSQYILPLRRYGELDPTFAAPQGDADDAAESSEDREPVVFGTLQVDVGDLRHLSHKDFLRTEKARMLDCLAEVFSASLVSVANAIENHIMLKLDSALTQSLSATNLSGGLKTFIEAAGEAFGVEMGHLRLVKLGEDEGDATGGHTLILETGFGACYELEKLGRREIHSGDLSPIICAFESDEPQIVNDVSGDSAWQAVLKSVPRDSELFKRLNEIQSYAAVSFNGADGKKLGALSFGSTKPWFFLRLHRRVLAVMADRVRFIVEHLRAKIQRDFLFKVSPELGEQKLDNAEPILREVTDVFREALEADVASLYLWDEDRERYILRAQSMWKSGDAWVGAASYEKTDGWIGVTAIDKEPLYVADLRQFYLEHERNYPQKRYYSHGRYARYMFGEPLSDTYTVEAVGLPLRIGPEDEDKFGVLTLYRRIEQGEPSGFVTTNIQLLQEGAYSVAGLVNAVLRHGADMWEKGDDNRLQEVHQGISSGDDDEPFEVKVCREVLKAFRATDVEFYRIDEAKTRLTHSWIAGYRRRPGAAIGDWEKMPGASADYSEFINETKVVATDGKSAYEIAFRRHRLHEGQDSNPEAVKLSGLVEQVCIPLLGDQTYLAALVIRWTLGATVALTPEVRHDAHHLQKLGQILGSAYLRRRMKRQAERNQLAVQTAGFYVFQHAHKLGNAIQNLYRIAQDIRLSQDEGLMRSKAEELETTATNYMKRIEWVIDLGDLIQDPKPEPRSLYELMEESWQDVVLLAPGYQIEYADPAGVREIKVYAAPKLAKEVFINILNNAVKAMTTKEKTPGERPELKVSAVVSEDKETVQITIRDNGVGMTRAQIKAAERGFVSTGQKVLKSRHYHKGVGVMVSGYLLRVQEGSLRYESEPGKYTEAIVTLPHYRSERGKQWNGKG